MSTMPLGSVEPACANVERVSTGIVETVRARVMGACKSDETSRPRLLSTRREDTGLRKTAQTAARTRTRTRSGSSVTTHTCVTDWMGSHARGLPSAGAWYLLCYIGPCYQGACPVRLAGCCDAWTVSTRSLLLGGRDGPSAGSASGC